MLEDIEEMLKEGFDFSRAPQRHSSSGSVYFEALDFFTDARYKIMKARAGDAEFEKEYSRARSWLSTLDWSEEEIEADGVFYYDMIRGYYRALLPNPKYRGPDKFVPEIYRGGDESSGNSNGRTHEKYLIGFEGPNEFLRCVQELLIESFESMERALDVLAPEEGYEARDYSWKNTGENLLVLSENDSSNYLFAGDPDILPYEKYTNIMDSDVRPEDYEGCLDDFEALVPMEGPEEE